jgi:hypothetical protein
MSYRAILLDTPWENAREAVRFTYTALCVSEEHAKLAVPLEGLLSDWEEIEKSRRRVEDAVVDANATVSALDGRLDLSVEKLVVRVLMECENRRDHVLFRSYFPENPDEIIRMGLASEIERTRKFHEVAKRVGASREVLQILDTIEQIQSRGSKALDDRKTAVANRAQVGLRMQSWKESANAARRSVEKLLDGYADQNNYPQDYSDDFFPAPGRTARKKTCDGGDGPSF